MVLFLFFLSKTRYGKNLIFFKSKKNRLIHSFKAGQIFTARVSNLRNLIREARDLQRCPYPRMDSRNPEFISAGGGNRGDSVLVFKCNANKD